ncbi:MAG: hypothetical protein WD267_05500 [Balneolales bacterium]
MSIDRIRTHTTQDINTMIDYKSEALILEYSDQEFWKISKRIEELDREWDIERWLQVNASSLAFTGLTLGTLYKKRWLMLPAIVLPFLMQHAIQGWCPPVTLFRKMGIRTRREIEREKYALKVLRGDFDEVRNMDRREAALNAFRKSSVDRSS